MKFHLQVNTGCHRARSHHLDRDVLGDSIIGNTFGISES